MTATSWASFFGPPPGPPCSSGWDHFLTGLAQLRCGFFRDTPGRATLLRLSHGRLVESGMFITSTRWGRGGTASKPLPGPGLGHVPSGAAQPRAEMSPAQPEWAPSSYYALKLLSPAEEGKNPTKFRGKWSNTMIARISTFLDFLETEISFFFFF